MSALKLESPEWAWAEFCGLPPEDPAVSLLAASSMVIRLGARETLIEQGDEPGSVYLIVDGALQTTKFTENGHKIWLADLKPIELIGEISILTGAWRTSAVVSTDASTVLSAPRSIFMDALHLSNPFAVKVAELLARRLQATSAHIADFATLKLRPRLHAELVRIGAPCADDDECFDVIPNFTVSELGDRLHASREATSRELTILEERGYLKRQSNLWRVILPK